MRNKRNRTYIEQQSGPVRSTCAAADGWNLDLALQHLLGNVIVSFGCPLFFLNRVCAKALKGSTW